MEREGLELTFDSEAEGMDGGYAFEVNIPFSTDWKHCSMIWLDSQHQNCSVSSPYHSLLEEIEIKLELMIAENRSTASSDCRNRKR